MILGIGVDIAEVNFWRQAARDPTTSVIEGTFTINEQTEARDGVTESAQRFATRFAAKEAFLKALSSGRFGSSPMRSSIALTEIEVVSDTWGRPKLTLHGEAQKVAKERGVHTQHLSLSHEQQFVVAMVVLEGET
ncbi:MAG: holo-ACP synthase [Bradymonadia bacterium]